MDDLAGSRAGVLLNRFIAEMSLRCGTEREGWSAITTTSHPPTDTRQTMTDRNGRERDNHGGEWVIKLKPNASRGL